MTNEQQPDPLEWHSGPPPHVGWWDTSTMIVRSGWRWWNGKRWSIAISTYSSQEYIGMMIANETTTSIHGIKWRWYYPTNARVPRIDPAKGARTCSTSK